jgi:PAS domain S-box-containing protein
VNEGKTRKQSIAGLENNIFFDAISDYITIVDRNYRIISYNKAVERQFGKDLKGKICYEVYQARSSICPGCAAKRSIESKKPEFTFQPATKVSKPVEIYAYPVLDENDEVAAVIEHGRDVSDKLAMELSLRENEKFIRSILDAVDECFIVIDRDYRVVSVNKAYCANAGMSEKEIIGRKCHEISHKSLTPCFDLGEDCPVRHTFETGKPFSSSHKHQDKEGNTVYVETKSYPLKDESGDVSSVIEIIDNITDKYLLEEHMLRSQKLDAVGLLAGGIAHDFNNLLQGIFGSLSMAKMYSEKGGGAYEMLEEAEKAIKTAKNLAKQLLTFSKGGEPVKKVLSLPSVIGDSAKFALSGSNVDYGISIAEDILPVEADEGQISQVIQNIVINAVEAMPTGGAVKIKAENITVAGEGGLPLEKGEYVLISIEDSGMGIPESFLPRIFDPYFTTKKKGSGLGLATSYSIVNRHGGFLDAKSAIGEGSAFLIYLPAVQPAGAEKIREAEALYEAKSRIAGGGRILVMDDEDVIRIIVGRMLETLGYEYELAEDGNEAIEKYRKAIDSGRLFDAVILDLTVRGGLGGRDTVNELLQIDPDVKAVVSSGYAEDPILADYSDYGFKAALSKPYDIEELSRALHSLKEK